MPMRLLAILLLAFSVTLAAQQPAGGQRAGGAQPPAPKNLKVLAPNTDMMFTMQLFNEALGVQCIYCHVQGDMASDSNPKKDIARKMIGIVRQIDGSFPSSTGVFPAGYHEVDCTTCHHGSVKPETEPAKEFYNRNESLGGPPPQITPAVNLKVLPPGTQVHGGGVMHVFRNSLHVDCSFCHGGGRPFEAEANPRKDIARNMILLVRQINTNFPGMGVFPNGPQAVTCWTCHRGEPHPTSVNNKDYGAPKSEPAR
jgi:hypothetical protein